MSWFKKKQEGPDQCGSVGWVSCCKAKGYRFDSWQSGHVPGLQVQSLKQEVEDKDR